MPANIDYAPNAGIVLDHDGRVVLYCILMNGIGKLRRGPHRIAEQIIHQVNAMGGYIVQRPAARHRGIDEPTPLVFRTRAKPVVRGSLGEYRFTDRF